MKTVLIFGAGPAGLTAAYELTKTPGEYRVTILEETQAIGGISRTVYHNGNRMDIGGHRFFTKNPEVNALWQELMPTQGAPSKDDIILNNNEKKLANGGPDPEKEEEQADIIEKLYSLWFSHEKMEKIIYWNLVDGYAAFTEAGNMEQGENYYRGGLLRFDMSEKPAFKRLKKLIKEV